MKRVIINILYFGFIGFFMNWIMEKNMLDWVWWVQVLLVGILLNAHHTIVKYINRN